MQTHRCKLFIRNVLILELFFVFFLLFTNQLHLESNKVAEFESRHSCSFSSFFSLQLFTFKQYGALNVKKLIYYELDSCSL